jgi:hypothetical protein
MPRGPHRRWKGCPLCKMHKHDGHGDAARMPPGAVRRMGVRRIKRISRHQLPHIE